MRRHDEIKEFICDKLLVQGKIVLDEPYITSKRGLFKPVVVVITNETWALVADVIIRYEKDSYLKEGTTERISKYEAIQDKVKVFCSSKQEKSYEQWE